MIKQRDLLIEALKQLSQFRTQLLQEEEISQKMTHMKSQSSVI